MVALAFSTFASPAYAQPGPRSNVDVLGDLAVGCIGDVPDTLSSFLLESSDRMPYLRPRLINYWQEKGHQVFLSDSLSVAGPAGEFVRLRYDPEEALVSYESADDSQLRRTITISIAHSLVASSGLIMDDGRCRDEYSDTIGRSDVILVQRDPFPETRSEIPPEGSWKTWAEPVVLGAAVGVVVYLFFTVRSS
ncbi:MAG: hypothetical protein ACC655_02270 [Rhodothermia bacterium]